MSVQAIFDLILTKSIELHDTNGEVNGLVFWHQMKDLLKKYNNVITFNWKQQLKGTNSTNNSSNHSTKRLPGLEDSEYKEIMSLCEKCINGHGDEIIIEKNHFFIQSVRLPTEGNNIRKLMQIALNIGQYIGMGGERRPWMNLNNYLSQREINKLNRQHKSKLERLLKDLEKKLVHNTL